MQFFHLVYRNEAIKETNKHQDHRRIIVTSSSPPSSPPSSSYIGRRRRRHLLSSRASIGPKNGLLSVCISVCLLCRAVLRSAIRLAIGCWWKVARKFRIHGRIPGGFSWYLKTAERKLISTSKNRLRYESWWRFTVCQLDCVYNQSVSSRLMESASFLMIQHGS